MKKILHITVFALATALLFWACDNDNKTIIEKEKVRLDISGSLSVSAATKGEGMINPILDLPTDTKGLPPKQLVIGLITNEYLKTGATPAVKDWSADDHVTELDWGFFGGNVFGDTPASLGSNWNGNIEYGDFTGGPTVPGGTSIQNVFYDENRTYYFFVAFYPYVEDVDIAATEAEGTGTTVYFAPDGTQDIMASTMGGGNIDNPYGVKDVGGINYLQPYGAPLIFYHKLTALRCHFIAESEAVTGPNGCGDIVSVRLINQPDILGLNIGQQAINPTTTALTDEHTDLISYESVRTNGVGNLAMPYPTVANPDPDPVEFGYILANPANSYTFEIITSVHGAINPIYATYTFNNPTIPSMGTVYNLTFKMLESRRVDLYVQSADEWWIDQSYN